jgi:hypothetical protein
MQNWDVIRHELESILGKEIDLKGLASRNTKAKVVTVSTNKKKDNFFVGLILKEGEYIEQLKVEEPKESEWSRVLTDNEYTSSGVYWIDKETAVKIDELKYLKVRFRI